MLRGPSPPLKILLVEDNLDHVVITRQAMASILPCEVEVVHDGAKAVARLTDAALTGTRPDLILLDLHLPSMSGIEVLRRGAERSSLRRDADHRADGRRRR